MMIGKYEGVFISSIQASSAEYYAVFRATRYVRGTHAIGDLRASEYARWNHLLQMDWFFPDLSRFADSFMSIPEVYRLVLRYILCRKECVVLVSASCGSQLRIR